MSRYFDIATRTELVPGIHSAAKSEIPEDWLILPDEHWFWQPLPVDTRIEVVNGDLQLSVIGDDRDLVGYRRCALMTIKGAALNAVALLNEKYPQFEVDSWPEQIAEASAWVLDKAIPTPLLDAIGCGIDDEQKRLLCEGILAKAKAYRLAVGEVIAWRRTITAWVEAQSDREQLRGFDPQFRWGEGVTPHQTNDGLGS